MAYSALWLLTIASLPIAEPRSLNFIKPSELTMPLRIDLE